MDPATISALLPIAQKFLPLIGDLLGGITGDQKNALGDLFSGLTTKTQPMAVDDLIAQLTELSKAFLAGHQVEMQLKVWPKG